MTKHEILLPFTGFYESAHDRQIDHCIEQAFDFEGTGCAEIPDEFHSKMEYSDIRLEYSKHYASWLQDKINEYLETENKPLIVTFKELTSPKYYNFSTDRLFAEISSEDILRLYEIADKETLEKLVSDRFTSRSGFSSFYQNSLKEVKNQEFRTSWDRPVLEWDHNQLGILLIAAILTALDKQEGWNSETKHFQEYHEFDDYEFIDNISSSGTLDNIIWGNCPKACLDMVNAYDEKKRA